MLRILRWTGVGAHSVILWLFQFKRGV